ncbi:MAG: UDP-N-acetylmuramate--L-alanine ligase [Candidatus Marinimicrobia bacterium]|nr:UDP-N-acetylmuramate--L-alanine ligase [Candidatus Neomarinimicrobiota bacterium]
MKFRKIKHIHFVGIGGIGMSGIAELLLNLGFDISGSDISNNENVERLKILGVIIFHGHNPENIKGCDVLVYSSAVSLNNSEIIRAKQMGLPVIKRAEMLGELINLKETSIAISGTHGKTTTSSMIGSMLTYAGKEPTLVVGGLVQNLNSNSKLGEGQIIVVEADEFDRSFLSLKPTIAIVNNIELEHTDCYKDLNDLENSFLQFCQSVPFYGSVLLNIDSFSIKNILHKIERPVTTYGMSRDAAFRAKELEFKENKSTYSLFRAEENLGKIHLNVPGEHNIMNSLGAVALGFELGLSFNSIKNGLLDYKGVRRRFDIKGSHNDVMVVDDYAHHPTEVSTTIEAAKKGWNRKLIVVFQPHLYTRTKEFYKEFAKSLEKADFIIITSIYPSREKPIPGITSKLISDYIDKTKKDVLFNVNDVDQAITILNEIAKPGSMILTLGAGDIWRFSDKYLKIMKTKLN